MAGPTGLEPATSAVTVQRSNQTELRPPKYVNQGVIMVSDALITVNYTELYRFCG